MLNVIHLHKQDWNVVNNFTYKKHSQIQDMN